MHNKKERTTIRSFNVILSFSVCRDAARQSRFAAHHSTSLISPSGLRNTQRFVAPCRTSNI